MKNLFNTYYIAFFCLCSNIMLFAQPSSGSDNGDLESPDTQAPIDENLWLLALVGLIFVFLRFKAIQARKNLAK